MLSNFKEVSTKDPTLRPDSVLELLGVKVSDDMNSALCKDFTGEEISNALF